MGELFFGEHFSASMEKMEMVLIGVDTSGKNGGLTLARARKAAHSTDAIEVVETVPLEGGTFSAQLIPQVAALLKRNGFSKQDIGAWAVVSGPGSFTGLRVGLAAVKGMAEVLGKPVAAVSLLEAIARASGSQGRVLAAVDASRNELYAGEYSDGVLAGDEWLVSRAEFASSVELNVVTTDAMLAETLHSLGKPVELVSHPGSVGATRLGWEKLSKGIHVSPEELDANYIRRSDAEIFSGKPASRS